MSKPMRMAEALKTSVVRLPWLSRMRRHRFVGDTPPGMLSATIGNSSANASPVIMWLSGLTSTQLPGSAPAAMLSDQPPPPNMKCGCVYTPVADPPAISVMEALSFHPPVTTSLDPATLHTTEHTCFRLLECMHQGSLW